MFVARLLIWLHKIDMADTKCAGEFEQRHDCRLRRPRSRSLTYCWVNPEISAIRSWVKPFSFRILSKLRPTSLRISMRARCGFTYYPVYLL